jgi:hypothetical protein
MTNILNRKSNLYAKSDTHILYDAIGYFQECDGDTNKMSFGSKGPTI